MSNQSNRQESVRTETGTTGAYEGDFMALFAAHGITETTYNGGLLAWINYKLSAAYTNLPGAQAALAAANSAPAWDGLGNFDAAAV